jgi:mono/diheme cytochrome c family protein
LSKTKALTLTALLVLVSAFWACSSGVGEKSPAASNNANANKPATPPATNAPTPPAGGQIAGMSADTQTIFSAKCAVCHGPDAKGGKAAPNILEVKDKHTSAEWEAYLKNTKIWEKDNRMPIIPLTDDERKKLADWLSTTTGKGGGPAEGDKKDEKNEKTEGTKKS